MPMIDSGGKVTGYYSWNDYATSKFVGFGAAIVAFVGTITLVNFLVGWGNIGVAVIWAVLILALFAASIATVAFLVELVKFVYATLKSGEQKRNLLRYIPRGLLYLTLGYGALSLYAYATADTLEASSSLSSTVFVVSAVLGLYALVMSAVLGGFWLLLVVAGSSVIAGFVLLLFTAITGGMGAFSEVSSSTGGLVVVSALCVLLASVASVSLVLIHPADD